MPLRKFLKWNSSTEYVIGTALQGVDHLHVRTLVSLRWMAILGQAIFVWVVAFALRFHIHLYACALIIGMSLIFNLYLTIKSRLSTRLKDRDSAWQLSFDTAQLALLLGVTGGLDNPFVLMLLCPPTVASANLPGRYGIRVVLIALFSTIMLYFHSAALPWIEGQSFILPQFYRFGALLAVLLGIIFTSAYAWRAASERDRMENALNATRAVLEKEHRLSSLGGLAAAAAHELGTPLGTIALIADEMRNSLKSGDPFYEDAELLVSQSQRCRAILKQLSQKPESLDQHYDQMRLGDFLETAYKPFQKKDKSFVVEVLWFKDQDVIEASNLITIKRKPEWLHTLSAFIENASDFATSLIWIKVHIRKSDVTLLIEDDGPGFDPDILKRLGEPYVTSRPDGLKPADRLNGEALDIAPHLGMGLGFFIAKTLCEHSGAQLTYGNRPEGGAYVKVVWPMDKINIMWS